MRIRWKLLALGFVVTVVAATYVATRGTGRTGASTEFEPNISLFAAIGEADQLTLYEGLPHPDEAEVFERERSTGRTTRLHGHLFYRDPHDARAPDASKLKNVLGSEQSFLAWRGEKKCGGFHPDFLVEWRANSATYRILICFGCGEVKVYGPTQDLHCDMTLETRQQLKELFREYRKNRPTPKDS